MSCTANVDIPAETETALANFKGKDSVRALKLVIEDEKLVVKQEIEVTGSIEQDFDGLVDYMEKAEPSFMIVRLEKTSAHGEFVLLVYIPVSCPIRPRTIFASSRVPVQRYISRVFTGITDFFFDDLKECRYADFAKQSKKDDAALSFDERKQREEATQMAVAQVQLPQHDTFTWELDAELKSALEKMAQKTGPRFVAGMGDLQGNGVKFAGSGETIEDIRAEAPRYVAIRYDDNGEDKLYFLLYCPDTAKPREKMMSSTCKASFLKGCKECGIEFVQNLEIRDKDEFDDTNLDKLIHPTDEGHNYGEVNVIRKPKRPGRR